MALYLGNKKLSERFYLDIRSNSLPTQEFQQYMSKSLTSFESPVSIRRLRNYCFYNFTSLTNVKIGHSIDELGANCFEGCSSLAKVWIPQTCRKIGTNCFLNVPSTCKIFTDTLIDLKDWASGWNGNVQVLYGKSITDYEAA